MEFAEVYKRCKKSQALKSGIKSVEACLKRIGCAYIDVAPVEVNYFATVLGYRLTTLEGTAFFPVDLALIPSNSYVGWLRDAFISADVVVPPYYQMGFLGSYAKRITLESCEEGKRLIGTEMLQVAYPTDGIAELICGVLAKRNTYEQYHDQLIESAKAYCLGLFGVAITGLLPCIEGVVRRLGLQVGLGVESEVSIRQLMKVFDRLKAKELAMMFDGYDWLPRELDAKFLARFHERVQMYDGIAQYFMGKLYLHTAGAPEYLTLNRHGISHGLFEGYATADNFLRLFNLLSALSMVAAIAEGRGSLMHPGTTAESVQLTAKLRACERLQPVLAESG